MLKWSSFDVWYLFNEEEEEDSGNKEALYRNLADNNTSRGLYSTCESLIEPDRQCHESFLNGFNIVYIGFIIARLFEIQL